MSKVGFLFVFLILLIFSFSVLAQSNEERHFSYDISFDFGLFASLNSHEYENLVGNKYSLQMDIFIIQVLGCDLVFL
ncbi:MAG: hypothetical protein ACOCWW_04115 [Bacteroidota bacterium]